VKNVKERTGRIDVLINNAGINIRKNLEDMSMEEWCRMMEVNVGSVFLGIKHVLPVMRSQGGGSIINTSSVCGLIGHRYTPEAYTATKGAVTMLTKSVAARYGHENIRCNSIHPSTVDTPLVHERLSDPQFAAERLGEVPLGRLAKASDVAGAVLYLSSDEASFINGVSLPVDGGVSCY
ncbi:MAG: SDR family oxidoreductase, partial [Lachnospiraceae bacterium]|nr:SDR family oxidoreductase [Lachnospiraceae bacterium]